MSAAYRVLPVEELPLLSLRRLLAYVLACALLVSCSGSPVRSQTAIAVDRACSALTDWFGDLRARNVAFTSASANLTDASTGKQFLAGFFDDVAVRTDQLVAEIDAGGAPGGDDGQAFVDDLRTAAASVKAAVIVAQNDVAALPDDDLAAFEEGAAAIGQRVATEVVAVGTTISSLDERYDDPDLVAALRNEPACQEINPPAG